ncbi:hypothetical protein, partial [Rhizobium leguminosarum]|uniref:hypothetical protein n=1 Tax=Rhizobium leguminosarum TaxID=384 RepID=UPI0019D447EE
TKTIPVFGDISRGMRTSVTIQKSVHDGLAVAKVCRQAHRLGWAPVPPLYLEPGVCDRQAPVALLYGQGD